MTFLKIIQIKEMERRDSKDCLPCRLISGGGLTGAGLYVGAQVSKQSSLPAKAIVSIFAGGKPSHLS